MRIAMITETYPPEVNGVARTVKEMVEGLRVRGHSIELTRPRQNGHDHAFVDGNLVERLGRGLAIPRYPQLKMGLPAKGELLRAWSDQTPDIVHIATEGPLGWSALAAARKLNIKVATDFHTNFQTYSRHYGMGWLSSPVMAYLRRFHNRADCTMVPTLELADELSAAGFLGLKIVGRGVNPGVFSPAKRSRELRARWGAHDDTPVALCVSRFAPEKNFPLVILAYEAMRQARPDTKLVLVGDGPMAEKLKRQNLGYVIAGRLVNGELSAHYASGDIFIFPSTSETFGNVTLEAMASGLGVVAYRYAAAREHLVDGISGLLPEPNDEKSFIAASRRLALDLPLARRLGAAARAAAESLTWERIAADFEKVLVDVAA
ncbi:MAG TPA: glycosyltransferase family 1 protein [Burkholderiales bacterium]|nr:glycosyltransferase family 1 protein [Burkholderiales bacterium]